MVTVFVALGANLAEPIAQLNAAVDSLNRLAEHGINVSPYYRSKPMGDVVQPDYVNAVASFETSLSPLELLHALQTIEQEQGRVRDVRWGPRTLDLDILLYGDEVIDLPTLTIPHYGMKHRSFVLVPLADIAPELILPCGEKLSTLISAQMRDELDPI